MSQVSTVTFITDAGGEQTLKVQNYDEDTLLSFWRNPIDEAIDGSLRSNLQGTRKGFTVRFQMCGEPSVFQDIVNNIIADITGGFQWFYFGQSSTSAFRVVPDEGLLEEVEYARQIGTYVPRISMKAKEVSGVALIVEDYRFVNEAVSESRDYGLITDAVTTSLDYGSIT